MKITLGLLAVAAIVYLILDMLWLLVIARGFYQAEIGALLKPQPDLMAAGMFYILYLAGMMVFVILPGAENGQIGKAIAMGFFFGLVAYGTYDLTNWAVLKGFGPRIALVDMAWGATVSAIVTGSSLGVGRLAGWFD
ncbi:MAG: DUF2177 family protein [Methylobacterium sp.]|nr:DUF2177 family protein [Methylobacterium sp.]MCA3655540.1 DUF2177 family protein [Methylobacterium sp.]MCA3658562.1 DUF2177 family protein [Methylobacterium sp.]MCA3664526.1 DUF2177 family protein [Methylobacterium sp.]MCA3666588.1 DUF2177 family protein [Methylobacterium sp.]